MSLQKNVASQKWIVFAFDRRDNEPKTGLTDITANLRIDGGAAVEVTDTNPSELEDGYYIFSLEPSETNGDLILLTAESATTDIQVIGMPAAQWTVAANAAAATPAPSAASIAAGSIYSLTFRDAIDRTLQWASGNVSGGSSDQAKRAVATALRSMAASRNWSFYSQVYRIHLPGVIPGGGTWTSIRSATYRWIVSATSTEYYCELSGGGDPSLSEPTTLYLDGSGTLATKGTVGSLAASEWGYGDNDSLGYNTVYARIGSDPDGQAAGYISVNGAFGTITYDHTGGSSERLLTFTTAMTAATRDWAPQGTVRINDVNYFIDRVIDANNVTLDANMSPSADIAAGTSYSLYQSRFTLPENFKKVTAFYHEGAMLKMDEVTPETWLQYERFNEGAGYPRLYSIIKDHTTNHRSAMGIYPHSDSARTVDCMMMIRPRAVQVTGYATRDSVGTVATNGEATVTGTSTAFNADHVGSLLRISSNTKLPTDLMGDNPYEAEVTIITVTNATSVVVSATVDVASGASVKYVISDPIDINPGMEELFDRGCELQMAIAKNKKGPVLNNAKGAYEGAWVEAAENEPSSSSPTSGRTRHSRHLADYPIASEIG